MRIYEFLKKIIVLITIHMHVFSNLLPNLLAAMMNLWAFQAAGTKEKVALPWSKVILNFTTETYKDLHK